MWQTARFSPGARVEKSCAGSSPRCSSRAGEVDRIGVHARRRAGLEAQEPHPRFAQTVRQQPGGDAVVGLGLAAVPADDDPPAERRTGRKDDSFCREERAERALYAADTAVFDAQRRDLALHKREVCRPLDGALHIRLIRAPVGL